MSDADVPPVSPSPSPTSAPVSAPVSAWWPTTLCTERLVLRPAGEQDLRVAEVLWRDERVRAYMGGPVSEDRIRMRRAYLPGAVGVFAVALRETGAMIGLVTIDPRSSRGATEVSYQLLPESWGLGLGREAVGAAVGWALDSVPGTARIVAVTRAANRASCRLLESIGMRCTDELVEYGERQALYLTAPAPTSPGRDAVPAATGLLPGAL
ncbi:GNAT family N-acetyltransferase [Streptomyces sp. NPDC059909]|uniref:GNAT family N-acetyltransferase n=1 Tax=Streptomyces sp. NPDC059909 TaxID=3346998 RepID=UPI003647B9DA